MRKNEINNFISMRVPRPKPTVNEKQVGHFYAVPPDKRSVVKIEIWESEFPMTQEFGPDTPWEHIATHRYRFYRTEHGRVVRQDGDEFVIDDLGGIRVRRLSGSEAAAAGLC